MNKKNRAFFGFCLIWEMGGPKLAKKAGFELTNNLSYRILNSEFCFVFFGSSTKTCLKWNIHALNEIHTCLKCDPYMPKKLSNLPTYQPTCLKSGHTCLKSGHTCLKSRHTSLNGPLNGLKPMGKGHGQSPGPLTMGQAHGLRPLARPMACSYGPGPGPRPFLLTGTPLRKNNAHFWKIRVF